MLGAKGSHGVDGFWSRVDRLIDALRVALDREEATALDAHDAEVFDRAVAWCRNVVAITDADRKAALASLQRSGVVVPVGGRGVADTSGFLDALAAHDAMERLLAGSLSKAAITDAFAAHRREGQREAFTFANALIRLRLAVRAGNATVEAECRALLATAEISDESEALDALERVVRREAIEACARRCEVNTGGHYIALFCAAAIRALAEPAKER